MSAVELATLLERRKVARRGDLHAGEIATFRTIGASLAQLGLQPDEYAVDSYERILWVNNVRFRIGSASYTGWRLWYDLDESVITIDPASSDDADVFAAIVACDGFVTDARALERRRTARRHAMHLGLFLAAGVAVLAAALLAPTFRGDVIEWLSWNSHAWRFVLVAFGAIGAVALCLAMIVTEHHYVPTERVRELAHEHMGRQSPGPARVISLDLSPDASPGRSRSGSDAATQPHGQPST